MQMTIPSITICADGQISKMFYWTALFAVSDHGLQIKLVKLVKLVSFGWFNGELNDLL